jgi:hypothetical protein
MVVGVAATTPGGVAVKDAMTGARATAALDGPTDDDTTPCDVAVDPEEEDPWAAEDVPLEVTAKPEEAPVTDDGGCSREDDVTGCEVEVVSAWLAEVVAELPDGVREVGPCDDDDGTSLEVGRGPNDVADEEFPATSGPPGSHNPSSQCSAPVQSVSELHIRTQSVPRRVSPSLHGRQPEAHGRPRARAASRGEAARGMDKTRAAKTRGQLFTGTFRGGTTR